MNNDFTRLFIMLALFNSTMGLNNYSDNEKQKENQQRLENKIDKILELLGEKGYGK